MKRYLLFDAGCKETSESAEAINKEAEGKLTVRSLRDPETKALLDRERPGWKWEPMLVEEKGDKVRIYAGRAISRRLLLVLGPRRAWTILQLVTENRLPQFTSAKNIGRRNFLRVAGAAAVSMAALMIPNISRADEGPFPSSDITHVERFAFVPLRSVKQVNKHIEKIEHTDEYQKIQLSIGEDDQIVWGESNIILAYDKNDNRLIGNVIYKPFVLRDGSRGAILGMNTDKATFVTAVALDNLHVRNGSADSIRKTISKEGTVVRGRVWALDSSGNVQLMRPHRRVKVPVPETGILPTDDHSLCVYFCGIMCSIGTGFLCSFGCAAVSGPAIPICMVVCAGFSYAYCNNCDWYCSTNGF